MTTVTTCIFEDTFLFSSRFLSLSLHFLTSLEIPIHLFGVWLIYTKTPKTMNSAKYSIMQLHITCSVLDFYVSYLFIFYVWPPILAGVPVGLLSYFGVSSVIQLYLWLNLMIAVALSAVASFENRYDAIVIGQMGRSSSRNIKRIVFFTTNFIVWAVAIGVLFWRMPDPEVSRKSLHQVIPCIPITLINDPMYVTMSVGSTLTTVVFLVMILAISFQGTFFFFYTLIYLFFSVRNVSKSTQQMQKRFFVAMTLQALIPMCAMFAPLFYFNVAFFLKYYNQMYNNFAMIAIGFNGLLTTIVMILVHAPYRSSVLEMLGALKRRWKPREDSNVKIFTRNPSRVTN